MKPRNKYQAKIFQMSENLPPLGRDLHDWAFEKSIPHTGYRSKKGEVYCMSCGDSFTHNLKDSKTICPGCNRLLKLVTTRKRTESYRRRAAFVSVHEGFQLVRYIEVDVKCKAEFKPKIYTHEILQQWFEPCGKLTLVGKNRYTMGCADSFIGDMEIRINDWSNKYKLYPDVVHPNLKVLSIFKRNGIKNSLHDVPPHEIFTQLQTDSYSETLLKSKQYDLLRFRLCSNRSSAIDRYWSSVKIAIRNNYKVRDSTMWVDYLDLLRYFRKDLRSAKFILPEDLKNQHDKLMNKKRAIDDRFERERIERNRENDLKRRQKDIDFFYENRSVFFGLMFKSGDINIKMLDSIEEFKQEADIHKHCVYSNAYYAKRDSLIFSASVDGKPIETVEFSLEKMKVVQSRGLHNKATEYHEDIVKVVERHTPLIQARIENLQVVA